MATTFPSTKQTFTDPSGSSQLSSGPDHATLHTTMNDTVEAIQDKIGVGSGTPTATNKLLVGSGNGTATWVGTVNNITIGTSQVTGGTLLTTTIGTPSLSVGLDATGDMYYRPSSGTLTRLGIGGTGQILTVSSGTLPAWQTSTSAKVLQVINSTTTSEGTTGSSSWSDSGLAGTITPSSASNKVLVNANIGECHVTGSNMYLGLRLVRGTTVISEFVKFQGNAAAGAMNFNGGAVTYLDSPASASAVTYKVQYSLSSGAGTVTIQKNSSMSTMTLMEVTP